MIPMSPGMMMISQNMWPYMSYLQLHMAHPNIKSLEADILARSSVDDDLSNLEVQSALPAAGSWSSALQVLVTLR